MRLNYLIWLEQDSYCLVEEWLTLVFYCLRWNIFLKLESQFRILSHLKVLWCSWSCFLPLFSFLPLGYNITITKDLAVRAQKYLWVCNDIQISTKRLFCGLFWEAKECWSLYSTKPLHSPVRFINFNTSIQADINQRAILINFTWNYLPK